jgi:hypothetical protein
MWDNVRVICRAGLPIHVWVTLIQRDYCYFQHGLICKQNLIYYSVIYLNQTAWLHNEYKRSLTQRRSTKKRNGIDGKSTHMLCKMQPVRANVLLLFRNLLPVRSG